MNARLPFWKIKREFIRIKQQLGQIGWFMFWRSRKSKYDQKRDQLVTITAGDQGVSDRFAVQLIYQPKALLESFFQELIAFQDNGYSVVVVSNAPVSAADMERLKPLCHLIVQRPNFGYDFGGYREGILALEDRGIRPSHLIIKNDSIWFPLREDCDLLQTICQGTADFSGIYINASSRIPHIQSYFYYFGPRLLQDDRFWSYWDNILLSDNKNMVIRQCEMKTTRELASYGYTYDSIYTDTDVNDALRSLDDERLKIVLGYFTNVKTGIAPEIQRMLGRFGVAGWRDDVLSFIQRKKLGRYIMVGHPFILLDILRCPVLKKDRQPMYQLQRAELMRLGFDKALQPVVRQEIMTWDDR